MCFIQVVCYMFIGLTASHMLRCSYSRVNVVASLKIILNLSDILESFMNNQHAHMFVHSLFLQSSIMINQ